MECIAAEFSDLELLWAEASAYSIGFANALGTWREALAPELSGDDLAWLERETEPI